MQADHGVQVPGNESYRWKRKYDFDKIESGESFWFQRPSGAAAFCQAFYKYKSRGGVNQMKITRRAVGSDDPRGAGYRVWFLSANPMPGDDI